MTLAELAVQLQYPDGSTEQLSFAPDRLMEVLEHVPVEDRPGALDIWLRNAVGERSELALRRADYAAAMDACLAALRGEPSRNPVLRLEDAPVAAPVPEDSSTVVQDLRRFLLGHPCTWIATGDLVRARRVVESVLHNSGYTPRTWTAALDDYSQFTPGVDPPTSGDDPSVAALSVAIRDEPAEPTGYVLIDLDTNDYSLESRSAREYFRVLATKVRERSDRFRLVVLKTHAMVPERWGGTVAVYRLAFEGATPLLDSLGEDLTARARRSTARSAAGRSDILQTIIEILNQRAGTPNVPLLVGQPGVGKSAVIEELARLIGSRGSSTALLPEWLRKRRILSLPASALTAGDTPSQEAQRIEALARELEVNREGILLFIDEAHELMARASDSAQPMAVQQLKAGLARGLYPLVLATTPDEQARIERDPAFMRRLVPVPLEELTRDQTIAVLREVWVPVLQAQHHLTRIANDALEAAVDGSDWYQPDATRPAGPIRVLARAASRAELTNRTAIEVPEVWDALSAILHRPISPPGLDAPAAMESFAKLDATLRARIRGQERVFDDLRPMLLGYLLRRPDSRRKPLVLMFVGPPGVGKTETAKLISDQLFQDEPLVYDMASYASEHQVADLLGSPPGYVGSSAGARLVRDIRTRVTGRAVLLFDEFGRAHRDIPQRLMRILDEGFYRDSTGRLGDFRDAIIILTSNDVLDTEGKTESELQALMVRSDANPSGLDAAILRRIDGVLGFGRLNDTAARQIAYDLLTGLSEVLRATYSLDCHFTQPVLDLLAKSGQRELGASPIRETVRRLEMHALEAYHRLQSRVLTLDLEHGDLVWR